MVTCYDNAYNKVSWIPGRHSAENHEHRDCGNQERGNKDGAPEIRSGYWNNR